MSRYYAIVQARIKSVTDLLLTNWLKRQVGIRLIRLLLDALQYLYIIGVGIFYMTPPFIW
jgi:hypothetical protein